MYTSVIPYKATACLCYLYICAYNVTSFSLYLTYLNIFDFSNGHAHGYACLLHLKPLTSQLHLLLKESYQYKIGVYIEPWHEISNNLTF